MKKTVEWVILVASLFLFAAASLLADGQTTSSTSTISGTTKNWPKGTPANVGLDEEMLKNLDADIASGKYALTDSFRVFRCGMEVFVGQYQHDYDQIYAKEVRQKVRSTRDWLGATTISIPSGTPTTMRQTCTRCSPSVRPSLLSFWAWP